MLVAFCRLYDVIIGEYVGGIDPAGNPFEFESEREASLTVKSAIYGDVRDLMGLKQEAMLALYRERLAGAMAVQRDEMRLKLAALNERRDDWAAKMTAILERGREEWTRANKTFETAWRGWAESFQNEYEDKAERWNDDYLALETSKNEWIADAERKLVQAGTEGVAEELGAAAEEKIAVAMSRLIGDVSGPAIHAEDVVARLTGNELFKRISSYASLLAKGVERIGTDVGVTLAGRDLADSAVMGRVEEFLADRREEISRHTGAITARTAEQAVEKAIEDLVEQVTTANESVDANVDFTMHTSGFTRNGAAYSRNAIIGSSLLGGDEHETQTLEAYRYFIAPRLRSGVDLRDEAVREMGQEGINALVAKAVRNLRTQFESIMGGGDEDDEAATLAAEATEKKKSLYEMWVGEAAELADNPNPRDIRYKSDGSGEMGRIFKAYLAYEVKRNAGESEARSSFYAKPLWNDTNMPFEAPSLRSIVDIGVTIVGTVFTSGIGGVLWNMIDDAIFTAADMAGGMDVGQAGLAFLKKAGGSLISFGVGEIGKVVGGALKLGNDAGGVIGKTLLKGAESFTTNAATGLLNAIEFDASGQLTWNANSYTEQLWGQKALAGYAGGMAGTMFSSSMQNLGLDSTGMGWNHKIANRDDIFSIGTIVGSAAHAGIEGALCGETTLSLLRIRDIGILEMRLGGDRKMFGLGMNGVDVSLGTIAGAFRGIGDLGKLKRYRENVGGSEDVMSAINLAAHKETLDVDQKDWLMAKDVLNGALKVRIDKTGEFTGKDGHGAIGPDGTMYISKNLIGDRFDSAATILAVMRHEGLHVSDPWSMTDSEHYRAYWEEGDSYNTSQRFYAGMGIMLDGKVSSYDHGVNVIAAAQRSMSEKDFKELISGLRLEGNKEQLGLVKEAIYKDGKYAARAVTMKGWNAFTKYLEKTKNDMSKEEKEEWEGALDQWFKSFTQGASDEPEEHLKRLREFMTAVRYSKYAEKHLEVNNALFELAYTMFSQGLSYGLETSLLKAGQSEAFGLTVQEVCKTILDKYVDIGYSPATAVHQSRIDSISGLESEKSQLESLIKEYREKKGLKDDEKKAYDTAVTRLVDIKVRLEEQKFGRMFDNMTAKEKAEKKASVEKDGRMNYDIMTGTSGHGSVVGWVPITEYTGMQKYFRVMGDWDLGHPVSLTWATERREFSRNSGYRFSTVTAADVDYSEEFGYKSHDVLVGTGRPYLDCTGYVNLVYQCMGYTSGVANYRNNASIDREQYRVEFFGITTPPRTGAIIVMEGHVAIVGEIDASGQMVSMYHSSPSNRINESKWLKDNPGQEFIEFSNGPKETVWGDSRNPNYDKTYYTYALLPITRWYGWPRYGSNNRQSWDRYMNQPRSRYPR